MKGTTIIRYVLILTAMFILIGNTAYGFNTDRVGLLTKNLGVTQKSALM